MNQKKSLKFTSPHALAALPDTSPVLLGLSGGADSRALLHLLADHCKKVGAPLYVAHVNHGIRGEEAIRDRDFCVRLAESYSLPCFVLNADVPALAREHGRGLEEEARAVRYEFFAEIMEKNSIPILATAHNSDDRLETLIFNIVRGSGLRGAASIPQVRKIDKGFVTRPLLDAAKSDIIIYCNENSLEFVTDSTNSDINVSRNLIRHKIVPLLEELNGSVRENAARFCASAREADTIIEADALEFISENSRGGDFDLKNFKSLPTARRRAVLSLLCRRAVGSSVEEVHISALDSLISGGSGRSYLSLPRRIRAVVDGDVLSFTNDSRCAEEIPEDFELELHAGVNRLPEGIISLSAAHSDALADDLITLDEKYAGCLFVRNYREGDKIILRGKHHQVRKLMSEKKLPVPRRRTLPLITDGENILWIPTVAAADGVRARKGLDLLYYKGENKLRHTDIRKDITNE